LISLHKTEHQKKKGQQGGEDPKGTRSLKERGADDGRGTGGGEDPRLPRKGEASPTLFLGKQEKKEYTRETANGSERNLSMCGGCVNELLSKRKVKTIIRSSTRTSQRSIRNGRNHLRGDSLQGMVSGAGDRGDRITTEVVPMKSYTVQVLGEKRGGKSARRRDGFQRRRVEGGEKTLTVELRAKGKPTRRTRGATRGN